MIGRVVRVRLERTPGLERTPVLERTPARKRSAGQALVEFAFVFPLIAMIAFAFIDLGKAVFDLNTLTNAAREAARVAAVNQVDPESGPYPCFANKPVEDPAAPTWTFRGCAMLHGAVVGVGSADVVVSYAPPPGTDLECDIDATLTVGCIATVTVTSHYVPITPVAGQFIGPITMTSTSSQPIERLFP